MVVHRRAVEHQTHKTTAVAGRQGNVHLQLTVLSNAMSLRYALSFSNTCTGLRWVDTPLDLTNFAR